MIHAYFPPGKRQWMLESNALYLDQLVDAIRIRRQQLTNGADPEPITLQVPE
jgi:hypothetical protein